MELFLKHGGLLGLLVVLVFATGCMPKRMLTRTDFKAQAAQGTRVLLMSPDIELYEITAGGLQEPKAEWTAAAKQNVEEAFGTALGNKNIALQVYQHPKDQTTESGHLQLIKLHDEVGGSIFMHQILPDFNLPTKKDTFDWSLGEGVSGLRQEFNADYAVFMFLRDSYSSPGRVAVSVATGILTLGHAVPRGGPQGGFASLVDLRSGNILWFHHIVSFPGDLREAKGAHNVVKHLLTGFPL